MSELRCWWVVIRRALRYFAYRLGVGACPQADDILGEAERVVRRVMRWNTRLRFVGLEHCPECGPAIFAGNHSKLDDPLVIWPAIFHGSNGVIRTKFMMRDDFFVGMPKLRIVDIDEVVRLLGTYQITRENVQLAQLKPFIRTLREGQCFAMYPGRTRTRSGILFEYRDEFPEPGSLAFFIAYVQRGIPGLRIPAVPVTRTHNPVTKQSVLVMGEPMYMEGELDRHAQREFDSAFFERLGQLVEVNIPHIVCGILYLRCLHGQTEPFSWELLVHTVKDVLNAIEHPHIDPSAQRDPEGETRRTVRYLARNGMLTWGGWPNRLIRPNVEAILASPKLDTNYRKVNPVKHILNHVIHLPGVTVPLENIALSHLEIQH